MGKNLENTHTLNARPELSSHCCLTFGEELLSQTKGVTAADLHPLWNQYNHISPASGTS